MRMEAKHITTDIPDHFVQGVAQTRRESYLTENNNVGGLCVM
jgi:hypothetical protein